MDIAKEWLGLFALIISVGGFLWSHLTSGGKAAMTKLDAFIAAREKKDAEINHDLAEHDRRIQAVESELKHMPDKDSVVDLKLAIAELRGSVGVLGETVGSVSRTVHRIDEYLRERAKQ